MQIFGLRRAQYLMHFIKSAVYWDKINLKLEMYDNDILH